LADGEVFDSAKLKNTIRFLIENDMRNIVIDLGNLEYLYSDTINAFIASNRHMLEVSGRIAILTEHPKVQDILKRAGLDNIMRIYRSEAEMIADAKEILRQTSSYRIDELQKAAAGSQGTVQLPQQIPTPPSIPKGEFEDFRFEIGQQLETKLDNNQVPQYQYGSQVPPAPPSPPVEPPPPEVPEQAAPYAADPNRGFISPSEMPGRYEPPSEVGTDYPTVQLPVGGYSQTPPSGNPYPEQDDAALDSRRQRVSAEDRLRSPNARKAGTRRVGGREGADESLPMQDELFKVPETPSPVAPYGDQAPPPDIQETYQPIGHSSSLIEEKSSSGKLVIFLILFVVAGLGIWLLTRGGGEDTPKAGMETEAPVAVEPQPSADSSAMPDTAMPPAEVAEPVEPEPTPAPTPEPPKPRPVKPKPIAREPKPVPEPTPPPEPKPSVTETRPSPAGINEIMIVSDPPGAEVLVNYAKKGVTPLSVPLGNNSNRIIIRLDGYKRYETTISKNTQEKELTVELTPEAGAAPKTPAKVVDEPPPRIDTKPTPSKPEPVVTKPVPEPEPEIEPEAEFTPPPAPVVKPKTAAPSFVAGAGPPGLIFLSSSPARADIFIDGKNTGKKTPSKVELPSGVHRIEMTKGGQKASVDHNVSEGKNKALHLNLQ